MADGGSGHGHGDVDGKEDLNWLIQARKGKAPRRRVGDWDGRPRDRSEDEGRRSRGRRHSRPRSRDRLSQRVDRRREEAPPRGGRGRQGQGQDQHGSAAGGSGSAEMASGSAAARYGRRSPPITSSSRECYRCGQEGHFAKDCRNAKACRICKKPGHMARDCPEKATRKRGREEENSGLTPPTKKNLEKPSTAAAASATAAAASGTAAAASGTAASAPGTAASASGKAVSGQEASAPRAKAARYSYSRAVRVEKGAWTIALSGRDGTSPDDAAISGIKEHLNGLLVKGTLEKGIPPAKIVGWKPTARALLLELESQGSYKWAWEELAKQSIRVETYAEHKARIDTTKTLSGFVRSPTSDLSLEDLKILVAGDLRSQGVKGAVTLCKVDRTPKGGLLWLKAEREAYDALVDLGLEIHVGAHGRVQLNEHGTDRSKELEEADLQERLNRLRQAALETQQKLQAAEAEVMMRASANALQELSVPKDNQPMAVDDGLHSPASHVTSYADSEGDDARMDGGVGGGDGGDGGGGTGDGSGGGDVAGAGDGSGGGDVAGAGAGEVDGGAVSAGGGGDGDDQEKEKAGGGADGSTSGGGTGQMARPSL